MTDALPRLRAGLSVLRVAVCYIWQALQIRDFNSTLNVVLDVLQVVIAVAYLAFGVLGRKRLKELQDEDYSSSQGFMAA